MIWLLLALGLMLRTISLNQSFWLDETAQAVLSRTPILHVNYTADFQPPLYYVLAHVWMQLGDFIGLGHTEWFLRLPSVFFGVATIYVTYLLGEKLFSKKTGFLAAGFLAIAPFHVYYSQEFRMYSLLTLLCALCWHQLIHKRWIALSLLVSLSLFTHYFAFVNLIAMGMYLLVAHERRGFGYMLAGLIPFSLWIPTLLKQLSTAHQLVTLWPKWSEVSNAGFIKFIPLLAAKWTVGMISPEDKLLYAASVIIFVLLSVISVISLTKTIASRSTLKKSSYHILVHYGVVSILIAWLGGLWLPAATPTRIQFVLPAIYLIIAQGYVHILEHAKYKNLALMCIGSFCAIQLFFSTQYLLNPQYHREDWRGAITFTDNYISSHPSNDVIVITTFNDKWAPMDWYSAYPEKYVGGTHTNSILTYSTSTYVILYTYLLEIFDPGKNVEENIGKTHKIIQEKDFRGVGILKIYLETHDSRTQSFTNRESS